MEGRTTTTAPPRYQATAPHAPPARAPALRGKGSQVKPARRLLDRPSQTVTLDPEGSAALRDRLVAELYSLSSPDDAAVWVHRHMADKNRLVREDALRLEERFREVVANLPILEAASPDDQLGSEAAEAAAAPQSHNPPSVDLIALEPRPQFAADKSTAEIFPAEPTPTHDHETVALTVRKVAEKPIRLRDKEHLKFVARQPCVVCGRTPSEAHHLRFAQPRALGRKVSDEFTVPVCRLHHRELHRHGDEASWWAGVQIEPTEIALAMWGRSRRSTSGEYVEAGCVEVSALT